MYCVVCTGPCTVGICSFKVFCVLKSLLYMYMNEKDEQALKVEFKLFLYNYVSL